MSLLLLMSAAGLHTVAAAAGDEGEKLSTPEGDVVVIHAPNERQFRKNGADKAPFATREQRLAVTPMQWLETAPPEEDGEQLQRLEDAVPGAATGGVSAPDANDIARGEFSKAWEFIEEQERSAEERTDGDNFDGTHGVFTRYPGNLNTQTWQSAPYNKVGKLYFTKPNGSSSYCTANVVSGNAHIVTAAHCVYTRGQGFNRNFRFVPAERFGAAPYGSFTWSSATVPGGWISNGGRRWDVGLIRLRNNSANRPVTFYVGWLGRSWNFGYTQSLHSFGYASNISTQYTNICAAQSFFSGLEGTDVLVKGCDMTFGASGGGFLRLYRPFSHGGNSVNGVVSGPHIGAFGTTYVGPRFSSSNIVPLCNTLGC